jgi:hypothetical protein
MAAANDHAVIRGRTRVGAGGSPEPGFSVEQFTGDIEVTGVPCGFLDHVEDDAAQVREILAGGRR